MPHTPRIGIQIGQGDPFWVQVREVMWQRAQALPVEVVEIDLEHPGLVTHDEQVEVVEDLRVQEIDALIGNALTPYLLTSIPDHGIPVVYLPETPVRHLRLSSRQGLYDAAHMLGSFLTARRATGGAVLLISGQTGDDDSSRSRLDGFHAALPADGRFTVHHIETNWIYDNAWSQVTAYLRAHPDLAPDAIVGLSDSLAIAARDAAGAQARLAPSTLILGINGDPWAVAAIADGRMTATVETDIDDIATQGVNLAYRAARGEPLPAYFRIRQHLVTATNVTEVATRKLISLADLPTRLVGVNRRHEQQRVVQLETSLAINRQVGLILDEQQLSLAITALIRDNYGFDDARLLIWNQASGRLVEVSAARSGDAATGIRPDSAGPLADVLAHDRSIFIPEVRASHRFPPDPAWPDMRARVVVPVHLGGEIVGLLDLKNRRAAHRTREELDGLQVLADQLGISMRNAELYGQALAARATAEKADRLKTALLANVSHELRTPLNVILGYSRAALDALPPGVATAPDGLRQDLLQIYRSGEDLLRLINDLLDLSRAEIDELDLLPERLDTRDFLEEVFRAAVEALGAGGAVTWRLDLPDVLPPMTADPLRLRQVLLNLLHNAHKFTATGQITLGATALSSELHLWVADTGVGIAPSMREQIFEPFISGDPRAMRHEGIGLGLSIARRLVGLHHGRLTVESRPHQGSTFHIYLPLTAARDPAADSGDRQVILLIAESDLPSAGLVQLAARRGLALQRLHPDDDLARVLETIDPALLAWDLAATGAENWSSVQQLRAHPQLKQLPVILYDHGPGSVAPVQAGIATSLLLKPAPAGALAQALADLAPPEPAGSILVVEDDPQTRALHQRLLVEQFPGYHVHDVGGGRAALDFLAHETPSLVVLDLSMPELDGFGVLEALRAEPRSATVPVLVLSGRVLDPDDIRRLTEARVIFQTKNVLSQSELADSLRRAVAHDTLLPPPTSALVKQAISFIQQHHDEPLSRQAIAGALAVSKDYLGRIFHQELGISPWEYLIRYRVLRAKELLLTTNYTVAEVAGRVGFDNATYFSHIFHREVGCTPRTFRAQLTHPTPAGETPAGRVAAGSPGDP
jgi:signal transduction histidine kinase/ABC-type sugar transport system substrate-binding protein/AraC-like DNA-binding protein